MLYFIKSKILIDMALLLLQNQFIFMDSKRHINCLLNTWIPNLQNKNIEIL